VRTRSPVGSSNAVGSCGPSKIEDEAGAFRLALAGSIPDTAIDNLTIGVFGARILDQAGHRDRAYRGRWAKAVGCLGTPRPR